jgi:hypothetical protein
MKHSVYYVVYVIVFFVKTAFSLKGECLFCVFCIRDFLRQIEEFKFFVGFLTNIL